MRKICLKVKNLSGNIFSKSGIFSPLMRKICLKVKNLSGKIEYFLQIWNIFPMNEKNMSQSEESFGKYFLQIGNIFPINEKNMSQSEESFGKNRIFSPNLEYLSNE